MPPPVILPDRLDPMTRAQLAQVVEARDSGTPIRSSRSIEKICDVSPARALTLWGLWREVSPFVFERPTPTHPGNLSGPVVGGVEVKIERDTVACDARQAADEEQDHAAALADAANEALFDSASPPAITRNEVVMPAVIRRADSASVSVPLTTPPPDSVIVVDMTGERVTLRRRQEPTHADPIDSAPVRDLREPDDHRRDEGADRNALVARPPDDAPGPAGGQADGLLPGLRAETGVSRPPRGKGKTVTLDEDQWHGAARTLADIVEAVTQQPARMMDPTAGRGRQLADVGTAIGWSRLRARLDAVVLAARGQPTLPAAVACWRQIQQDGVGRVAMLLRADGANLLRDLDAEVEDLAAGRLTLAKEAPRQVARTTGGRDDGDRSVTADDVRAVLARRGYRQRDEIVGEVADG